MTAGRDRDEALLADVRDVMSEPRAPDSFHERLHDAVDAGFLDPPRSKRVWPIGLAVGVAAAAVLFVAVSPRFFTPSTVDVDTLQVRSADGIPLAVEMSVLTVAGEGDSSSWVHAGDSILATNWLRFRLEAPPGVFLILARSDPSGEVEVFYRWPQEGETVARVARDGDIWYSLEGRSAEQTFLCLAADRGLDDSDVGRVVGKELISDTRVKVERLPVVVME